MCHKCGCHIEGGGAARCLYGLYTAEVSTTNWPTVKTSIVEPHQNTLLVLFLWTAGGWCWVGGRFKGSRVLSSRKFHYPIDTDPPPSQRGLVRSHFSFSLQSVFQFFSFSAAALFTLVGCAVWQLQTSDRFLAEGIIMQLQMEEKVWYCYSGVGVRRRGIRFAIQCRNALWKLLCMGNLKRSCLKIHQISFSWPEGKVTLILSLALLT